MNPPPPPTPRSVRFNISDSDNWINDEDPLHSDSDSDDPNTDHTGRSSRDGGRAPLLTSMEAPSVALANDLTTADLLDTARPKSGMKMAFMNMANSIM